MTVKSAMPLELTSRNLDIASRGLSFDFHDDGAVVAASITLEALQDLGGYHHLNFTKEDVLGVLLPEIERLVRAKRRADRLEENGGIVIRPADLLRYGFHGAS